ncbi:MAG: coenzyme F420-0:L-glutamate ligase [Clostridia bacterium]|nr:coenzyme F420-0:L-glutamate ligase [Clostridia bacterium]
MQNEILRENEGKNIEIAVDGKRYHRIPIKTKLIVKDDDLCEVAKTYAGAHLKEGDILFISEKAVACSEGRAIPMKEIKPRRLAKFLTRFVYKSPYGIGLGIPETMEMALRECGVFRILFAAGISAVGKLFRRRGWFYKVAGYKARSIDGPTQNTIPPYNEYVVLGPKKPNATAKTVASALGCTVLVVDINDIDGVILGSSDDTLDRSLFVRILKDNPLGQDCQQTPMGIIRPL